MGARMANQCPLAGLGRLCTPMEIIYDRFKGIDEESRLVLSGAGDEALPAINLAT